ncbi:MAG TPA: hypothetical protein VM537_06655 [Anaerolineae bacterium]|nr:hypothetical protein [Anaerolineae bacterium]
MPDKPPSLKDDFSQNNRLATFGRYTEGQASPFEAAQAFGSAQGTYNIGTVTDRVQAGRSAFGLAGFDAQRKQESRDAAQLGEMTAATREFQDFQTFTDEDFKKLSSLSYAQQADEASRSFLSQSNQANSMFGSAGLTGGGGAATLGAQLEQARFGQIVEGQRRAVSDLKQVKMQADAADAFNKMQARTALGSVMGKEVPTTALETIQAMLELDLAELGILKSDEQAKAAAQAAKPSTLDKILGVASVASRFIPA